MRLSLFATLFCIILILPLISSDVNVGTTNMIEGRVVYEEDISLWCKLTGCTITGDFMVEGTATFLSNVTITTPASVFVNTSLTIHDILGNPDIVFNSSGDSWFNGDGNVGIGTTSPTSKLHVDGNIDAPRLLGQAGSESVPSFTFAADLDTGIFRPDSNHLGFSTAANERMRIDNTGNVGIGTTSPDDELHVMGDIRTDSGSTYAIFTHNQLHFTGGDGYISTQTAGSDLIFRVSNAQEKMRILSTGNVGIGTTSPATILHLNGTNPVLTIDGDGGGASDGAFLDLKGSRSGGSQTVATIRGFNRGDNVGAIEFGRDGSGADHGQIRFRTAIDGTLSTQVTIDDVGKVGIGTASPTSPNGFQKTLQVNSSDHASIVITEGDTGSSWELVSASEQFRIYDNTSRRLTIDENGNVGIGTVSPSDILHVYTATAGEKSVWIENNVQNAGDRQGIKLGRNGVDYLHLYSDNNNGQGYVETGANFNLNLGTNDITRMTIDTSGNVGIGTVSPARPLHINGTGNTYMQITGSGEIGEIGMRTDGLFLQSQSNDILFADQSNVNVVFKEGGNVGIGTTAPTHELNVVGDVNFTGDLIANNVFLPQYLFSHTNATIAIEGLNEWTNITFSQEDSDIKTGIAHTYNDDTNDTFTIMQDGIYEVDYDLDIEDTSGGASDVDVAGRLIYINGTEVIGSVFETDITKNGAGAELSHDFLIMALAGDEFVVQFVGSDADVVISTHGTFGETPESATIVIKKIANLP